MSEIDLTDELVSEEDLAFEVYGMALKDHILRGTDIYELHVRCIQ